MTPVLNEIVLKADGDGLIKGVVVSSDGDAIHVEIKMEDMKAKAIQDLYDNATKSIEDVAKMLEQQE